MSSSITVDISPWFEADIRLPGDEPEFAVGDVHGHADEFAALLDAMSKNAGGRGNLTLLGDFIDRGEKSVSSLRWAALPAEDLGFARKHVLFGNHETLLLPLLDTSGGYPSDIKLWIDNGGRTFLDEIGLHPTIAMVDPCHTSGELRKALGQDVLSMLYSLQTHRGTGNLFFIHAGVDPYTPLDKWLSVPAYPVYNEHHFAWIREPFLCHDGPFEGGKIVVHGHSPEIYVRKWKNRPDLSFHRMDGSRLGLDGGSFKTGVVAGAEFRNGGYRTYLSGKEGALRDYLVLGM